MIELRAPEGIRVVHSDGTENSYGAVYSHTDVNGIHRFIVEPIEYDARDFEPGSHLMIGVMPPKTAISINAALFHLNRPESDPE